MKKTLISICLVIVMLLSSCASAANTETQSDKAKRVRKETKVAETRNIENENEVSAVELISVPNKPKFESGVGSYKELEIVAKVAPYQVNADLSNIENLSQFSNLTQKQRERIAEQGFVVVPTNQEQLFYIYEDNAYKKIPGFITTDSVLQLYHLFFDYSLRNIEQDIFYPDLIRLNSSMLAELNVLYAESEESDKDEVGSVLAYFGACMLLLDGELPDDFPTELVEMVNEEYRLANEAAGRTTSPIAKTEVDYSLFKVRGHYTRTDELGRYFKCMSMYGVMPFVFFDSGKRLEDNAKKAIIATGTLYNLEKSSGIEIWEKIYSTTEFFVGAADDLSPHDIAYVIQQVYGGMPKPDEIDTKMDAFYDVLKKLRKPQIVSKREGDATDLQMRFMGQRYIADSEILQNLSEPFARAFPTGLDVFAVFGSKRAEELLDELYKPKEMWEGYVESFQKLAKEFRGQSIDEQTSNIYNSWLYALKSLPVRHEGDYPFFMKNTAWEDKSLATSLGSWAEMRHDTILYGKQSAVECGGSEPPAVYGYVEPNPEFYNRLQWLLKYTKQGLYEKGMLEEKMAFKFEHFIEMLEFLKTCSIKELNGEDLSPEEYSTILTYGGSLEYISSSIADSDSWYLIESDTDKNMAIVADIHTAFNHATQSEMYLEVGVGHAAQIYVAVPIKNQIYLTRGAVFDYYEFKSEERLTDEQWQELIKTNPPDRPEFVESFMDFEKGEDVPTPAEPYVSGC